MCGICGVVYADPARPAEPDLARAMLARLAHRGPDGSRVATVPGAALGHARLAVIDLSPEAAQPMAGEDGRVLSVVNGEIYNHRALRAELEAKGHRFRSRSDSEVVVHLVEEHGPDALGRLEGMFAIAVWDGREGTLLLARDPMGEKPLYWHASPARLLFASELGALLADPGVERRPDDLAIHRYLTFKCVPSPATGLRGIYKLPPGHRLIWRRGEATVRPWTTLPRPEEARRAIHLPEEIGPERLREAIGRAVEERLEADVPVGVLLSGGIDSAVVAYEASRRGGSPLKTFTVGFDEADYDESAAAGAIAARIGSEHHSIRVKADVASELPAIVARYGEPFGDSSAAAVWFLAREVRRHVTVALGGDGGDELFGGYDRHRAVRLGLALGRAGAGGLLSALGRGAARVPLARGRRNLAGRLDRFARAAAHAPARGERGLGRLLFSGSEAVALLRGLPRADERGGPARPAPPVPRRERRSARRHPLRRSLARAAGRPAVQGGHRLDGVRPRGPLAAARPGPGPPRAGDPGRAQGGAPRGKQVLRDAYAGLLPDGTVRGRKAGFGLPVDRWLRGPLNGMARELLLGARCGARGYFDQEAVAALLREHESGRANHDDRLWALVCLELWFRGVVEGEANCRRPEGAVAPTVVDDGPGPGEGGPSVDAFHGVRSRQSPTCTRRRCRVHIRRVRSDARPGGLPAAQCEPGGKTILPGPSAADRGRRTGAAAVMSGATAPAGARRIRVLHVITQLELGGAQQNTLYTCAHLDRSRFEASLACGPGGILDDEARAMEGVPALFVPSLVRPVRPHRDLQALVALARLIRGLRPDIVHTHSSKAGIVGRWAARLAGVRRIVHSIHGFGFHDGQAAPVRGAYIAAEKGTAAITSRFIAVSRANRDQGAALGLFDPARCAVIRSGIALARYREAAARPGAFRRELGIGPGDPLVGMIACLKPQKAPLDFVETAARVLAGEPRTTFVVAGDGELRGAVEAAIARVPGGAGRIRLLGWRRDTERILADLDLLLLTSRWEGLPRVLPEAMAAGKPVVATAVDGSPEAVAEG